MTTETSRMTDGDRAPGLAGATLCEAFQLTAARFAGHVALRTPGDAEVLTWGEYAERVRLVAGGLRGLGVGPGETVAMMLINRPEFHIVDTAALHLGATPFSVYNTSSPAQIQHLFANAQNRVVVTERRFIDKVRAAAPPSVEHVLVLEDGLPESDDPSFASVWSAVSPSDIATLIYTSGTTGPPKGVQLTHANVMFALRSVDQVLPHAEPGRLVSYLPHAHLADRFVAHYTAIATGASVTSVAEASTVVEHLADVRPTSWLAVPRIWEKIKARLEAHGLAEPAALAAEARAALRQRLGLADARYLISGAAPIAPSVLEYFAALGLPILEGWAMSETGCVGTMNPPGAARIGTVGRPVPGIELSLADDGELLMKGANVMAGYRNDPEKTAEAIDADGWLHTGDIATIDHEGYVAIVDRKKELIINAAGKNMSPANIELALKSASPLIGQCCAIGDRRPFNVALLVLDPDAASGRSAMDADLLREVAEAVQRANATLSRVEQIKRFKLLGSEWLPDGDELTPTLKLKRRVIAQKYAAEIDALYM
jgi:long-subunit acyl-CoA synthetase (AMP-forming)